MNNTAAMKSEQTPNLLKGHVGTLVASLALWLVMLSLIPFTLIATLLVILAVSIVAAAVIPLISNTLRANQGSAAPVACTLAVS